MLLFFYLTNTFLNIDFPFKTNKHAHSDVFIYLSIYLSIYVCVCMHYI